MASNYSTYTPSSRHHPQYVYYAPNLARHPVPSPYYYVPAVPIQAVPVEQLHPRSRSFNDLYGPYHQPQQAANASPTSVHASVRSSIHQDSSYSHLSNASPSQANQALSNQPASDQGSAASASSTQKPLRYRGRMARSKSHSSLVATPMPDTQIALSVNTGSSPSPLPLERRRMSSTSSIQRNNYSASMSSTDGGSTPSIMSTADTDSLTTQTSLSSTSSVDEEAKNQKANHARRRGVVNTLAEKSESATEAPNNSPHENFEGEKKRVELDANSKNCSTLTNNAGKDSPETIPLPDAKSQSSGHQVATEGAKDPVVGNEARAAEREVASNVDVAAPEILPAAAVVSQLKVRHSRVVSKSTTPQASEASQAREASVKPARSAKHAKGFSKEMPKDVVVAAAISKEMAAAKDESTQVDTDVSRTADKHTIGGHDNLKDEKPTSDKSEPNGPDQVLTSRPKRTTAAAPSKLVLPSDLQPRSYYQSSNGADALASPSSQRHARSASWYTATTPVPSKINPGLRHESMYSGSLPRSRSPSAQSESQSPVSSESSVFLQRSYASRQRPTHSMPPRRPESHVGAPSSGSLANLRTPSSSANISTAISANSSEALPKGRTMPLSSQPAISTTAVAAPSTTKMRSSRSFGSVIKGIFSNEKTDQSDDISDAASITSTRSSKSMMSVRSSSSGFSLSSRFRRKKNSVVAESTEPPAPPPPAPRREHPPSLPSPPPHSPSLINSSRARSKAALSATPSPVEPIAPRPPSPALGSIGRQVAPNLTAGDIYPGLLRPNEVDTIISSLERTGSFERKPSTSRRSKEQKVPGERVILATESTSAPCRKENPLKSALKGASGAKRSMSHIAFAKNTLVYNTYSASEYNRTPEPLPYDLHDRRVVVQLFRELNDLKLSMPVHPSSKHHTQYLFGRDEKPSRTSVIQ